MIRTWAVLKTRLRYELLAARAVGARGPETYVPMLPPTRRSSLATPLFPGYLFATVVSDSDDLLRIRSAPGIAYVLPQACPPVLLPDEIVAVFRRRLGDSSDDAVHKPLKPGERVTVVDGPFRWIDGVFDSRLNASGRVRILLDFVHRPVPLDLDELAIRRAG